MQKDKAKINPRWVLHTLTHRGLPGISLDALEFGVAGLAPELTEEFHALVDRLHNGSDQLVDMETMAEWSRSTKKAFAERTSFAHSPPIKSSAIIINAQEQEPARPDPETQAFQVIAGDVVADPKRQALLHPKQQRFVRESHHVYGSKAALCIEPTLIDDAVTHPGTPVFNTLSVEMAPSTGDGHYKWEDKITFRLTRRELSLFVAAMMGWIPSISMSNHGPNKDKTLEISDQGNSLFIKLRQAKRAMAVPVPAEEVFTVATLALKMLVRNSPELDSQTLMLVVKRTAAMHQKTEGVS